ncbi:Uncharacterised protein [Chlamydia trachomatis]|nr:Uncharacterised protein [Chlamydia trachomatis]
MSCNIGQFLAEYFFKRGKTIHLFKKKTQTQDSFKQLIHRLSDMSERDLIKVNQLLDVVFEAESQPKISHKDLEIKPTTITV